MNTMTKFTPNILIEDDGPRLSKMTSTQVMINSKSKSSKPIQDITKEATLLYNNMVGPSGI